MTGLFNTEGRQLSNSVRAYEMQPGHKPLLNVIFSSGIA
jgi:hypothetical protein